MRPYVFIVLFVVLLFTWVGGFLVYHIAGFFIHVLLILAIIALVLHLFRSKPTP